MVGTLLLLQIALLALFVVRLSAYFTWFYLVLMLLSIGAGLVVINKECNPSYKMAWMLPILLFPLFGGLFYWMFSSPKLGHHVRQRLLSMEDTLTPTVGQDAAVKEALSLAPASIQNQSTYLQGEGFPVYGNTDTRYLSPGENKWEAMLADLKAAKRYIFLEYFIIEPGKMWDSILAILEQKVAEGIEVRLLYDGFGCLLTLPDNYWQEMRAKGIQCVEFNPLLPVMSLLLNNRDHRKIAVIDGHIGYMGGVNLADEYINAVEKHGHWKDSAIRLHGDAVWSLVVMFLSMWEGVTGYHSDPAIYRPLPEELPHLSNGFVQPYQDSPLDNDLVGEMVYLNLIHHATDYVYICSPYLIIDNETITALLLAAKSGVDVRIITPHIGDKWYVHTVTRAYYPQLVRGGVKIYEYTPGFIHCKSFVVDDAVATCGTVNLDYRSLYLHFECGMWMAYTSAVSALKEDFLETLTRCEQITLETPFLKLSGFQRLIAAILRLFSPLM